MKIKENFVLRSIAERNIVVPIGQASLDFNAVIILNDTGAFLWNRLSGGASVDEMHDALCKEYDVDRETADKDITAFVERLRRENLLDE